MDGKQFAFAMDFDRTFDADLRLLSCLQAGKLYEPEVSEVFCRALRPGDTVVDVGANVGWHTLLAASLVGPNGRVVACEPGSDNLAKLQANIDASDFGPRVSVVSRPISDRTDTVEFHLNRDASGGHALWNVALYPGNDKSRASPESIRMASVPLDELMLPHSGGQIRLIKIDVEGAEQRVLQGAAGLIAAQHPPLIIAELHQFGLAQFGDSQESLRNLMARQGYETFALRITGPPLMVPQGTRIECPGVINLLFSTPTVLTECWPVFRFAASGPTPEG
jgi:FkbM family methyltransferase